MPAAKKRKVTATISTNNPSSARATTAFTKVSKSQVVSESLYDKAESPGTNQLVQSLGSNRKRKLLVEEIKLDTAADQAAALLRVEVNQSNRDIKSLSQRRLQDSQRPPQASKKPILIPPNPIPEDTPTNGARAVLDQLFLAYFSPSEPPSAPLQSQESSITDIKVSSCETIIEGHLAETVQEKLPIEVLDLINLHASFLTTLTLYHAHNGTNTPADLRLLCPDVSRAWGKRKVMLDDIRRVLGVVNSDAVKHSSGRRNHIARLSLVDYGHGKICVEVKRGIGRGGKITQPLNENRLNATFERRLRILWEEQKVEVCSVTTFIETLPLETITICSSLTKMSPLLAKGQRRLEDFRAGIILKKLADSEKKTVTVPGKDEKGTTPTLLERLEAKELRQSSLPALPSKAELSRKAALHRLDEVIAVLSLLTTSTSIGQQRVSFTLPTVLGRLRDSFKTPMSKEEGETCVRLLASDIAPEWLRVVKMGKVDAVVVNRDNRPSDLDIQERVKRAT